MKNTGNCKYEVKAVIGHKLDGSPIRKSFYGKSKREAKQKATDYIVEHGQEAKDPASRVTYAELNEMYMTDRRKLIRNNTEAQYECISRIPLDEFNTWYLSDITKRDVTSFADRLSEKYSYNYTKSIVAIMSSVFAYGIDNNIVSSNPCKGIRFKSSVEKRSRSVYTEEEAAEILKYTLRRYEGLSVHIMLSYGTTISETLGIQYSDIDFKSGTIKICRSVTKSKGNVVVDEPKNKHRKRTIAVSQETLDYIKSNHDPEYKYLIHSDEKDLPYDPQHWRWQVYKKFMEAVRIHFEDEGKEIPILNPHELRHTRATIWVNSGVNLFAIAEEMGWTDLEMLRNVYGHPDIHKIKGMLGII